MQAQNLAVASPELVAHLAKPEVANQIRLRAAFDKICKEANGYGPSCAYFETVGEFAKRYAYVSFGMTGEKPQGKAMAVCTDFDVVFESSVKFFREWLQPNRTLVWREKPSADLCDDGKYWASYWRCIQLDDDAKSLVINWHF